jgi:Zn-dependent peptidase ImmA (M78 family)
MIDNKKDINVLEIFSDGFGTGPENAMSPEYACDAIGYLQYQKPIGSIDPQHIVIHAANSAVSELKKPFKWIADELADADLTLDFMLDDTPYFFAQCTPTRGQPNRALTIYIGLGCIPVFVGITNRLLHFQKAGPLMLEAEMQGRLNIHMSTEKWHPKSNPVGMLTYDYVDERNTSTSTVDAMLLIFFHEVAHALRGHAWIRPNSATNAKAHRRALESDADFCAGYLFMKYELQKLDNENRMGEEPLSELCQRLAVASASLNCALQVRINDASELYHLPHMRTRDNYFGAELAWNESKIEYDFVEFINDAYGQLGILDKIIAQRLSTWIAQDDPRNVSDENERKTTTELIVRGFHERALQLERGPIKGARILWNSIMYPKLNFRPASYYLHSKK